MKHIQPLISLEYVSKSFGDDYLDYGQMVIRNISLTIQSGEFLIIFGPSGSGKSTLLNMIAGLERPTAGRVLIRDHDLANYDDDQLARYHRRKMGMVFQSFNLIKSLSVWENIALPQTAEGVPYAERLQNAKRIMRLLGLQKYVHRHTNELSGGEQQRVAIARALINKPLIMLVDEPTGNLDSKSADDVMRILHGLHTESKHTILLVTHNPEYLNYATRVIYLQDGEIKKQEWNERQLAVKPVLPQPHFVQLAEFKTSHLPDGSLAPADAIVGLPIGSPARPAGIGASAVAAASPTTSAAPSDRGEAKNGQGSGDGAVVRAVAAGDHSVPKPTVKPDSILFKDKKS